MLRFSMAVAICRWADAPDTSYSDPFPTPEICMAALSFGRRDRRDHLGAALTRPGGRVSCMAWPCQHSGASQHTLGHADMGSVSAWLGHADMPRVSPRTGHVSMDRMPACPGHVGIGIRVSMRKPISPRRGGFANVARGGRTGRAEGPEPRRV